MKSLALILALLLASTSLAQTPAEIRAALDTLPADASPVEVKRLLAKLIQTPIEPPKPEVVLPPGDTDLIVVLQGELVVDVPEVVAVLKAGVAGAFQILAYPPPSKPEPGKPWKPAKPRKFVVTVAETDLPPVVVPDPDKPPVVVPIPTTGFRVLVLEESGMRSPALQSLLRNPEVEGYLNSKTAKGPEGKPEWRVLDDDLTSEQQKLFTDVWKSAYERAKVDAAAGGNKLPWLLVSDGSKGESLPLPMTRAELLPLLKKYGGQ